MSDEKYQVLRSRWFTPQSPAMQVGVVAIKTGRDGDKWKAYIGLAGGMNQEWDEQFVAGYGAKIVEPELAHALFPDLPVSEFVT